MATACASDTTRFIVPTTAHLPVYTPSEAALYDDSLAQEIFGLPAESTSVPADPKLIERTQKADVVVRARIATVTRDTTGGLLRYALTVTPVESPWVGELSEGPVELPLRPENPTMLLVRARPGAVAGKTLVLFLRKYNDKGEVALHFRAEPDTPAVRQGVERAHLLGDLHP